MAFILRKAPCKWPNWRHVFHYGECLSSNKSSGYLNVWGYKYWWCHQSFLGWCMATLCLLWRQPLLGRHHQTTKSWKPTYILHYYKRNHYLPFVLWSWIKKHI